MNKLIEINVAQAVTRLYQEDMTAKAMFDIFSARQKDAHFSPVDLVSDQTGAQRWAVIKVLKALEEAGCGRFITGRRGHKSRMEWNYSIRSLAEAAKGNTTSIGEIDFAEVEEDQGKKTEGDDGLIHHPFKLRVDLTVELSLPPDLTIREADRISAFVKTLPLE